jgi:hypothetical protein
MATTADLPGIGMAFRFVAATTVVNGKLLRLSLFSQWSSGSLPLSWA